MEGEPLPACRNRLPDLALTLEAAEGGVRAVVLNRGTDPSKPVVVALGCTGATSLSCSDCAPLERTLLNWPPVTVVWTLPPLAPDETAAFTFHAEGPAGLCRGQVDLDYQQIELNEGNNTFRLPLR